MDTSQIFLITSLLTNHLNLMLLRSGDIHPNPGPPQTQHARVLCANIRGLKGNLNDLSLTSTNYDVLCCSETLVSEMRHISELLIPNFKKPILFRRNSIPRAQGMCVYIRSGFNACRLTSIECKCHEIILLKITSKYNNFYLFSVYRNPDLDNSIYDCLLTAMATVQSSDRKAVFVFMGDFNAHHTEWLESISPTDQHGRAALDFATLSGCEQIVLGPTHRSGNRLDLVLTDVPGVVDVEVIPPIGTSDHSSLSITLQREFIIPNIYFSRKVFLKSQINWPGITQDVGNIDWHSIYHAPCPVEALNNTLLVICERRVPSKHIKTRLKDKAWFNDNCRQIQRDKQAAYRLWTRLHTRDTWENYVRLRSEAQRIYGLAEAEYNNHLKTTLTGTTQPHKWWSALKKSLFGVDNSIPPLCRSDGSVTFDPCEKANILADVFESKQSDSEVILPHSCSPEPMFSSFAFRSSEIQYLLNDLDPYGGTDPNGFFPLFFKGISKFLAPKLAVVFRILIRRGLFPDCWRTANVTPIPKGSSPTSRSDEYRPISITPVLSKVYERLLAKRLTAFANTSGLFPSNQFGFRKGLGTCDALLVLTHDLQASLDAGHESRLISLDFSAAFDLVNHRALLFKLSSMGVGGSALSIISSFLTNRRQRVVVEGKYSPFTEIKSGVPQGSVLGPLLFILFTSDMWSGITSKLIAYADDASLYASIRSPCERAMVANTLRDDIIKIFAWCERWGMRLNPSKTHSLIISRSRTDLPSHPPIVVNDSTINNCNTLKLLGVTLDAKLTFEPHLRSVASSVSQKVGLLRKCRKIYSDDAIVRNCFYSFILPFFEYCSPVWLSAAESNLKLLDRAFGQIRFLLPNLGINLAHRRLVGSLALFHKIYFNPNHPLHSKLPLAFQPIRLTRHALGLNDRAFTLVRCNTNQYSRCFIPSISEIWNSLPNELVNQQNSDIFKTGVNSFLNRL